MSLGYHHLISLYLLQAESQNIRANVLLNRKREKVSRKYTPAVDRRRQLSPGFLEDALDEVLNSVFILVTYLLQFSVSKHICVHKTMTVPLFTHPSFLQEDEPEYYDSRRSQRRFEDDLEAEARAEKRIMNAKKVSFLSLQKFVWIDCFDICH